MLVYVRCKKDDIKCFLDLSVLSHITAIIKSHEGRVKTRWLFAANNYQLLLVSSNPFK